VDTVCSQGFRSHLETLALGRRLATWSASLRQSSTGKASGVCSFANHGTEYTCNAMLARCRDNDIDRQFIVPCKPMQNGFAEGLKGRMRN